MHDLLTPDPRQLADSGPQACLRVAAVTLIGFAMYGFTVGFWRSPLMGVYVAVKMPLLIVSTLACNGLFNGLMAMVLGSGLGFRQSLHALLSAFAISALILGSLAPVTFFLAVNAPSPESPGAVQAHAGYLLAHTALMAIAGAVGVLRLRRLLTQWCPSSRIALTTLGAWIAGNAFIGAQFSWIFRPFFGSPGLDVAFLRDDPMRGSFYEAVWKAAMRFVGDWDSQALTTALLIFLLTLAATVAAIYQHRPTPKS